MARRKLTALLKNDVVYVVGLVASGALLLAGIVVLLARPLVLRRLVLPVARTALSADGIIEPSTIRLLDTLLMGRVPVALLLAGMGAVCHSVVWRYFSSNLPRRDSIGTVREVPSVSTREACLLAAAIATALVVRLHGITRGLGFDEIFTAMHFVEVDSIWETVSSYIMLNNHIAYSVLARFSEATFGRHEWALRLPALLLGLAGVYCMWIVGRKLGGPKVAIAASFCLALCPPHVRWSESARGYTGMIVVTLLSSCLYFELLHRPKRRDALKFVLASVGAIYFHLYAVFVTVVQLLFCLCLAGRQILSRRSRSVLTVESFQTLWLSSWAILALSLTCYAPVLGQLIAIIEKTGHGRFQPTLPFEVLAYLSGSTSTLGAGLVLFLSALGLISLWISGSRQPRYWVLLYALPVLTMWVVRPRYLSPRFFVYLLPYCVLLVVSGAFTFWDAAVQCTNPAVRYFLGGVCALVVGAVSWMWISNSWEGIPEARFRDAAEEMQVGATESTGFCAIGGGASLFQYYFDEEVFIPSSVEEFGAFAEAYAEVRCAYNPTPWERTEHSQIGEFLYKNGTSKQLGHVTVFTYRR